LEVSQVEAARLKNHTVKQAMENEKLLLVLDLDHTLLHSTRISDLNEEQTKQLHGLLEKQPADGQMLYHLPHMGMWTKLRPGIQEFFSEVRKYYDLHVFTMGDKSYAAAIANLLDPSGQMFGGRVASSSDAGRKMIKDLDVLLGSDEIMLILDDTVGVWPRHKRNLIQVQRYIFFPACAVRFGAR
jgi:RNA polymerase II C-terminal domain phosphatase-like 3/4